MNTCSSNLLVQGSTWTYWGYMLKTFFDREVHLETTDTEDDLEGLIGDSSSLPLGRFDPSGRRAAARACSPCTRTQDGGIERVSRLPPQLWTFLEMEEPRLSKTERRDKGTTGGTHGRKPAEPFGQGRLKFWQLLDDNFVRGIGSWLLHKHRVWPWTTFFFLRSTVLTFSEAVVMVTQGWPFRAMLESVWSPGCTLGTERVFSC